MRRAFVAYRRRDGLPTLHLVATRGASGHRTEPDQEFPVHRVGARHAPAGEGRRLKQGQAALDGLDGFFGGLPIAFAVFQVGLV